jgi:hypothetical protein
MEDLPGDYILVDRETYVADCRHVRVIQGKLIFVAPTRTVKLLQPNGCWHCLSSAGCRCVVSGDQPHTKWSMVQQ